MTKQEAIESKEKNKAIYTGLAIRDTFEDTNRRRKSRHIMSRKQIIIHMLQRGTQCANVVATVIKWRRRQRGGDISLEIHPLPLLSEDSVLKHLKL